MIDRRRLGLATGLVATAVATPIAAQTVPDALDRAASAFTAGLAADDVRRTAVRSGARKAAARELARAIAVLERLDARPAGEDVVSGWRQSVPAAAVVPLRGRGLGPGYERARLAPAQVYRQQQVFIGGELARVVVAPGPRSRLLLEVADRDGTVICRTVVQANPGSCGWTPVYTSRHTFRVSGVAGSAGDFVVLTN